jgi:hypothetical protein
MDAEHREAVRALHQFNRRRPARVDLHREGGAAAGDEVHVVESDEPVVLGHARRNRVRRRRHGDAAVEKVGRVRQDAAAVLEVTGAKGGVASDLARHAERHGDAAGRHEHDRAGDSFDAFLKVVAVRHRVLLPGPDAPSTA